jgi:hypothetical protein
MMTTLTPTLALTLAESQQALIDARLDTIERMLHGRVPRADRTAILHEVESQILELLAGRDPQLITNEDIIDVLRRLDPPEAYLASDEMGASQIPAARRAVGTVRCTAPTAITASQPIGSREGKIGGILGISSLGLLLLFIPMIYTIGLLFESEIAILGGAALAVLLAIPAAISGLVFSIRGRQQGVLPIFGIVSAALTLPLCLIGSVAALLALA